MSLYKKNKIRKFLLTEDEIDNMSDAKVDQELNKLSRKNDREVQKLDKEESKEASEENKNTEQQEEKDNENEIKNNETEDKDTNEDGQNNEEGENETEDNTGTNTPDVSDSNDTSDDNTGPPESPQEKSKKTILFKQYEELLNSVQSVIVSTNTIKDKEETLQQKENQILEYALKNLKDLQEKIEYIVYESFLKLTYQKLLIIFVNLSSSFFAIVRLIENVYGEEIKTKKKGK